MWDETNFLLKGFINEVKGVLTESGGASGGGFELGSKAGAALGHGIRAVSTLDFTSFMVTSSAGPSET